MRASRRACRKMAVCYCFDMCCHHNHLTTEGVDFVGRTREVVVGLASPWAGYFGAVYNGQAPRKLELWRVNIFYLNTPAWRAKHPGVPNPFRDCEGEEIQSRCASCTSWETDLRHAPSPVPRMGCLPWPQARPANAAQAEMRLVQVMSYPEEADSIGRELAPSHSWVEIMRSDARPYFEEGVMPPNCTDWAPGEPYRQQQCWSRLHSAAGGRFPPGCWARPVTGSGIWINTNKTIRTTDLRHWQSVYNTTSDTYAFAEWPNMLDYTLFAASQAADTLQVAFGDPMSGLHPPLLVVTSPTCMARREPLKACLTGGAEMRAGWADLACECDDSVTPYQVDMPYLHSVEAQGEQQPPLVRSPTFQTAGAINCKSGVHFLSPLLPPPLSTPPLIPPPLRPSPSVPPHDLPPPNFPPSPNLSQPHHPPPPSWPSLATSFVASWSTGPKRGWLAAGGLLLILSASVAVASVFRRRSQSPRCSEPIATPPSDEGDKLTVGDDGLQAWSMEIDVPVATCGRGALFPSRRRYKRLKHKDEPRSSTGSHRVIRKVRSTKWPGQTKWSGA